MAATALNAPLGWLYAFSVFSKPLEALLGLYNDAAGDAQQPVQYSSISVFLRSCRAPGRAS